MNWTTKIAFLLLLSLQGCNYNQPKNQTGLKITSYIGGINFNPPRIANNYCDSIFNKSLTSFDTSVVIHIATTIENTTDDTICFLSWSCSYEEMFVVSDTLNFAIQSRDDCFTNVPELVVLSPGQKTDRYIMIRRLTSYIKPENRKKIKLGMRLFTPQKNQSPINAYYDYKKMKNTNVIWSNDLDLNRLSKESYTNE